MKRGQQNHASNAVLTLLTGLCLTVNLFAQWLPPAELGIDLKALDTSVKPCRDFYQFANGNWLAHTSIPADRPYWAVISEVSEKNFGVLHQIADTAAADTHAPKGSAARKVGDFYRSGMAEARIETEGATPLAREFARIAAIKNTSDLQAEFAHMHRQKVFPAFLFFVSQDAKNSTQNIAQLYQGGLALPDRDFYANQDERTVGIRDEYVKHIGRMFELLGDDSKRAASEAGTAMALEIQLARVSQTRVERRDPYLLYNKMKLAELRVLTPRFSWDRYFAAIGLAKPSEINVGQPEFFKELDRLMTAVSLDDWKTYLRWTLINATASKLSSAFVKEDFHFNSAVIFGAKDIQPRWQRVLQDTDQALGEALGQLFVARVFSPEAKVRAQAMVLNLREALRERLLTLDWIGEDTRQQALQKLEAMKVKIGYPDKWRDYSALAVDQNSYVLNYLQANAFEFQRQLKKIGKPLDRDEWNNTPMTVDASYNANLNEIVFPAGILQPPYFDPNADDASNFGAIGVVIGHELTHGFDDQGRQFDARGNLKNWWSREDENNFNARASQIEKQFDDYILIDDVHTNGKLTRGENIADLGGVRIAYLAFQKSLKDKSRPPQSDGSAAENRFTSEQRFFIAYAQIWRALARPEVIRILAVTDTHAFPRFRVIGPLANIPEFAKAFNCQASDATLRSESKQVQIW
ncbi:MAG: M13 family metallopeptidase [Pyrinomonadaceae bacterium]